MVCRMHGWAIGSYWSLASVRLIWLDCVVLVCLHARMCVCVGTIHQHYCIIADSGLRVPAVWTFSFALSADTQRRMFGLDVTQSVRSYRLVVAPIERIGVGGLMCECVYVCSVCDWVELETTRVRARVHN